MISARIITSPNEMFQFRDKWEYIFCHESYEPSTSFEWTIALKNNHSSRYSQFFLIVLENNNEAIGFVPVIIKEDRFLGKTLATLSPVSELYNTHSDMLVTEYSDELITALLGALLKLPCKWDLIRITRFLDDHPLLTHFINSLTTLGIHYRIRAEQPSFFLTLDSSFDNYLSKRSGKFRNYLKRMQKKLSASGQLRFVKMNNSRNYADFYKDLLSVEQRSWKHDHGTAISAVARQTGFYNDFCREALNYKRLHVLFLYLDDTPIAYDMGYIHRDQYYYLKTSFDDRFKPSSPASVLRAKLIEELITDGIKYFDFPGEPYSWERQWTNEIRWHKSLLIFNSTAMSNLYRFLSFVKEIKDKRHDSDTIHYLDPRDLRSPGN